MTSDIRKELKEIIYEAYQAHSQTTSNLYGDLTKRVGKLEKWVTWVSGIGIGVNFLVGALVALSFYVYTNDLKHIKEIESQTNEYTAQKIEAHDVRITRLETAKSTKNEELRTQP